MHYVMVGDILGYIMILDRSLEEVGAELYTDGSADIP